MLPGSLGVPSWWTAAIRNIKNVTSALDPATASISQEPTVITGPDYSSQLSLWTPSLAPVHPQTNHTHLPHITHLTRDYSLFSRFLIPGYWVWIMFGIVVCTLYDRFYCPGFVCLFHIWYQIVHFVSSSGRLGGGGVLPHLVPRG